MSHNTRVILILVLIVGLLAAAFLCRHKPRTGSLRVGPASASVAKDEASNDTTDISTWLQLAAGILAVIEVAIQAILKLLATRRDTGATNAATNAPAPQPSG